MTKMQDHSGHVFGRLTAIKPTEKRASSSVVWLCQCECGNTAFVGASELVRGKTRSCGCYRRENSSSVNTKHGHGRTGKKTPEYMAWCSMNERCNSERHPHYNDYGGRGIGVCESWRNFKNFFEDMGPRPSRKHTLDRIDNSEGYSAENCRWATMKTQNLNRRNTVYITSRVYGKITIVEAAKITGKSYACIMQRIRKGWTDEEALGEKVRTRRRPNPQPRLPIRQGAHSQAFLAATANLHGD